MEISLDNMQVSFMTDVYKRQVLGSIASRCRRKRSKYSTWGVRSQE